MPHLLTEEQKLTLIRRVGCKLMKSFQRYNQKTIMNVVIGYETWIHFFEQHRKISNRAWLTKDARKPFSARRIASVKKVMYDIFSTTEGLAIKISVPKAKSMNARFYKKKFLESLSTSSRNVNQRRVSKACICYMTTP